MNLITAIDVAERLQVSRQRVYEQVRLGIIPRGVVVMVGPRQLRFDQDALNAWVAKGGFAGVARTEEPKTERPVDTAGGSRE